MPNTSISNADVRALAAKCAEHADIAGKIFVVPKVESEFRALAAICRELLELRAKSSAEPATPEMEQDSA